MIVYERITSPANGFETRFYYGQPRGLAPTFPLALFRVV